MSASRASRGADGLVLTRRDARPEALSFPTRLVEHLRGGRPASSRTWETSRCTCATVATPSSSSRADPSARSGHRRGGGTARSRGGHRPERPGGRGPRVRSTPPCRPASWISLRARRGRGVSALRVAFVFASKGIGGAERSMLRLMATAHPTTWIAGSSFPRATTRGLVRPRPRRACLTAPFVRSISWASTGSLRDDRPEVLYAFGRFRIVPWALGAASRACPASWPPSAPRPTARATASRAASTALGHGRPGQLGVRDPEPRAIVGVSGPPAHVVPNGLDANPSPPPPGPPARPEASLFCVGNITPNKGQGILWRRFASSATATRESMPTSWATTSPAVASSPRPGPRPRGHLHRGRFPRRRGAPSRPSHPRGPAHPEP